MHLSIITWKSIGMVFNIQLFESQSCFQGMTTTETWSSWYIQTYGPLVHVRLTQWSLDNSVSIVTGYDNDEHNWS